MGKIFMQVSAGRACDISTRRRIPVLLLSSTAMIKLFPTPVERNPSTKRARYSSWCKTSQSFNIVMMFVLMATKISMSASGTLTKRIPSSLKGFRRVLNLSANVHDAGLRIFLVIAVGLNANVLFAQPDFREGYL